MVLAVISLKQVFLVGLAYQGEVRPDNQDHMPEEGLPDRPSLSLHISDTCAPSHGEENVCSCINTHISPL